MLLRVFVAMKVAMGQLQRMCYFVFAVFACTLCLTFGEGSTHSRKLELNEQRILDRLKLG